MDRFTGLLGIVAILSTAVLLSTDRRAIRRDIVLWGLGLQFTFAFLVLKTSFGKVFEAASGVVNSLLSYAEQGSTFLFGNLANTAPPIFAFKVLPIVIFMGPGDLTPHRCTRAEGRAEPTP